jgi:hypothetical protein
MTAPHTEGLCDWCFWPLNGDAVLFNEGVGHSCCVSFMHELITTGAEDAEALPWPQRLTRDDPVRKFVERLGRSAVRHRVPINRLDRAIQEALPYG